MDAFLLISLIVVIIVLLLVNIYVLAIYIHPDDKGFGSSILAKILVVIGLTLSWGQVFMVPLDVANARGEGGGLDMDLFWKIVLMSDAILLIVLIPFGIFRYEGDEEAGFFSRLGSSICYTIATMIVFALVIGISFAFLRYADIPVTSYAAGAVLSPIEATDFAYLSSKSVPVDTTLEISVSFPVYIMAFFSLVGWLFFLCFGGLGLFSIPMDLINAFRFKPKQRTQKELANIKQSLQSQVGDLLEMGQTIKQSQDKVADTDGFFAKRKAGSQLKRDKNKFKAAVLTFEKEFEIYTIEKNFSTSNPLVFFLKLLLGLVLFVISVIWWIHILVYSVIRNSKGFPASPFLNNLLIGLNEDAGVGFIATAIFAALSIYLIWAVTKGNIKFGLKIPFLFTLHPMRPNETLMNSFLFNVWLIMVSSIAVVQFVTSCFQQYVRLTTLDMLFGTQVKYMRFYEWFFSNRVFEIAFLVMSGIGLILVCCWSRRQPKEFQRIEELKKEIAKYKK